MLMFPPRRWCHHNLRSTDGLTILTIDHTMEASVFTHWCNTVGLDVKPHQIAGHEWCMQQENDADNRGGIICDEMGLGKTVQLVAFLASLS